MIESQNDKNITMRCVIKNQEGSIISSGIAQEVAGSSFINKGSHVEKLRKQVLLEERWEILELEQKHL